MKEKKLFNVSKQIIEMNSLYQRLLSAKKFQEKSDIIDSSDVVSAFLTENPFLRGLLKQMDKVDQFLIKVLLAIGQGSVAFQGIEENGVSSDEIARFIFCLKELENFYEPIGGIFGYHLTVLKMIEAKEKAGARSYKESNVHYQEPEGVNLSIDNAATRQSIRWGLEHLGEVAEIYPLGGAGDRLNLKDEQTGQCLPVAQLQFCGRSLLEGMVRDVQGREFLYYKIFGKQIFTPLAIMTSHEKNNHERILQICRDNEWFGRDKSNFFFFIQNLVPMITIEGYWAMHGPLNPILKPGGHGVIWKVGLDEGLFEWLEYRSCQKAVVRQINNPAAGIDNGLLGLIGIGCHKKKKFGFASCSRLLNMPEGMDVLREKQLSKEYEYCITNVEYTEFEKQGIRDCPKSEGSPFSQFPANTNILFVDLQAIKPLIHRYPIPGALINMKTKVTCLSPDGEVVESYAGRLESTMQNIADYIVDRFPERLPQGYVDRLSTFLTYNDRKKTISVTKEAFVKGKSFLGTPEGCHFEMMQNYRDLLANYCHFHLPIERNEDAYLIFGPEVLIDFHPAVGMLYQVISQKIRRGSLAEGSEWNMEISEVEIVNLTLKGSVSIEADSVMGEKDSRGVLVYDSLKAGKCTLINATIENQGITPSSKNVFWKQQFVRKECLKIVIHGNGEFYAANVHFKGDMLFEVPDAHRMVVEEKNHQVIQNLYKIDAPTWMWRYAFDEDDRVVLERVSL